MSSEDEGKQGLVGYIVRSSVHSTSSHLFDFKEYSASFYNNLQPTVTVAAPVTPVLRGSPFTRDPPEPEEVRQRVDEPSTMRDYLLNLREDLADFQAAHGISRSRDYTFLSLGMALAQETGRAIYSVVMMSLELVPIVSLTSLIFRFILEKLIEILEQNETTDQVRLSLFLGVELVIIILALWMILTIILLPLAKLLFKMVFGIVFIRCRGSK